LDQSFKPKEKDNVESKKYMFTIFTTWLIQDWICYISQKLEHKTNQTHTTNYNSLDKEERLYYC
jgi:hypothetical protein